MADIWENVADIWENMAKIIYRGHMGICVGHMGICVGHMGIGRNIKKKIKKLSRTYGKNGGHVATEHFSDKWENSTPCLLQVRCSPYCKSTLLLQVLLAYCKYSGYCRYYYLGI
jgi:hypothetical protein